MSSGMRILGRRVPEPLPEVHLQGDLDLHEAEERPRHAVLPEDGEQRHRDHVARERVLARRDQRGELVEALEEHPALHRREPHARDLEEDRLEQPERRAALAAPVDRVAEVLPGHLDEGGHEPEEGGLDLARGFRGEGRHQRLEEDDEALDRLCRVAPRAAADGLDEAVAALREDGRGQVEKAALRDRRLAGEDRGEKGGERLAVAAGACRSLRGRGHGHPGVGDEPLELREEIRVERVVRAGPGSRPPSCSVCGARAAGNDGGGPAPNPHKLRAATDEAAASPRLAAPARPPVAGAARLGPALRRRGPGPGARALAGLLAAPPPPAQLRRVSRGDRRLVALLRAPGPAPALPPPARGAGHGGRAHARPALGLGRGRDGPALPAQAPLRRAHRDRHRGLRRAEVLRRRLPRALPRPLDAPRLAAARPGLDRRHRPTRPALAAAGHLRRPRGRGARRRPRHRPRPRGRPRAPRGSTASAGAGSAPGWRRNALRFQRTDEGLAAFFRQEPIALVPSILLYVAGWFLRAVETWLFLRLVGVDVPLPRGHGDRDRAHPRPRHGGARPRRPRRAGHRLRPLPQGARGPGRHDRGRRLRPAQARQGPLLDPARLPAPGRRAPAAEKPRSPRRPGRAPPSPPGAGRPGCPRRCRRPRPSRRTAPPRAPSVPRIRPRGTSGGAASLLPGLEANPELRRRVREGHEGGEGHVEPLRRAPEAQRHREGLLADREVPVLVLQDDRHLLRDSARAGRARSRPPGARS